MRAVVGADCHGHELFGIVEKARQARGHLGRGGRVAELRRQCGELGHIGQAGGANGDLDEFVGVELQRGAGTYILGDATTYVPFSGLQAILVAENQSITASGSLIYTFSWSVATDIVGLGGSTALGALVDDNIIQGDTVAIDITFVLTQN